MGQPLTSATSTQAPVYFSGNKTLDRQEAKSWLQTLIPGSQEHSILQNALIKKTGIVDLTFPNSSCKIDTSDNHGLLGGFGSSEHVAIGKAVKLKGLPDDAPVLIKGATNVFFSHIVALAGDFYGVPGQAISLPGGSDEEKTIRFKNAFNNLADAPNDQVRKVILEIDGECAAVEHSGLPHHCYSSQMMEKNSAIKKIKSDIDELLIDNSDHFSVNAEEAYRIGHTLAMAAAKEAGKQKDLEGLKRAYALEAFACHFFTDLFASGHIRNQRGDLETFLISQLKFSLEWAKKLAGILTGAQHEKDGKDGLNVCNKRGDNWRAYGDGNFFSPKNAENRKLAISATQQSVDEIYKAYMNPDLIVISKMDQVIPHAADFNPPPIYSVENNATALFLHRRSNIGIDKIPIQSASDYINKVLLQAALNHLPQKYIDGYVKGIIGSFLAKINLNIEMPPILTKVAFPLVERFTGTVWACVGIATYHQVKQESQKLNEKMDEMGEGVMAIYDNTVRILEKLQDFDAQFQKVEWKDSFQEIKDSIKVIMDAQHQDKIYQGLLDPEKLKLTEIKLWDAHITLSRVFHNSSANGKQLLPAYQEMLEKTASMDPSETRIAATLWFRQMIDYQVEALTIHGKLKTARDKKEIPSFNKQVLAFENSIITQIEVNKKFIEIDFIDKNASYIQLQLKKSEITRIASSKLKKS